MSMGTRSGRLSGSFPSFPSLPVQLELKHE
jgi:hypothetical protein